MKGTDALFSLMFRILWKKNEVADYEATTFSIFYNNTLFLVLVIIASFFLLKNFNPTVYPFSHMSPSTDNIGIDEVARIKSHHTTLQQHTMLSLASKIWLWWRVDSHKHLLSQATMWCLKFWSG